MVWFRWELTFNRFSSSRLARFTSAACLKHANQWLTDRYCKRWRIIMSNDVMANELRMKNQGRNANDCDEIKMFDDKFPWNDWNTWNISSESDLKCKRRNERKRKSVWRLMHLVYFFFAYKTFLWWLHTMQLEFRLQLLKEIRLLFFFATTFIKMQINSLVYLFRFFYIDKKWSMHIRGMWSFSWCWVIL